MLIEFSVANFRSFRGRQSLSMAASAYFDELRKTNCLHTGIKGLPELVRTSVIYGPNAAGKSNLVSALKFLKFMVVRSATATQEGDEIGETPFLLDKDGKNKQMEFEITFLEGSVRYQFGFSIQHQRVKREWLVAYPEGRPQKWFERHYNQETAQDDFTFGSKFQGGKLRHEWAKATRRNALFLSVAVQLNCEQLRSAFSWFQKRLRVLGHLSDSLGNDFTKDQCAAPDAKNQIVSFLNAADLGIADIALKSVSFEDRIKGMPEELHGLFRKHLEGKEEMRVEYLHRNLETEELVSFSEVMESQGTRNLFAFAGPWFDFLANDRVLVVDEIESSLHPLVVRNLVQMLQAGTGQAQLLFTTHDISLLGDKILRRDQIWFVEKDREQSSHLFPLTDFKVRDADPLLRNYLLGKYGAIPFISQSG